MHSAMLQSVRAAFDEASKRGCSKAREHELPPKRVCRQISRADYFTQKGRATTEMLRRTCTRYNT